MLGYPVPGWEENGISIEVYSLDEDIKNLPFEPIIVNDVADEFSVGRTIDTLNDLIRLNFDSDELNTIPSCSKGCTTGEYNYDPDDPIICEVCDTPVISIINEPLHAQVWMRVPDGVRAFVHPRIYQILSGYFKTTHFDLIEWLTVPTYTVGATRGYRGGKREVEALMDAFKAAGFERGINYFYDHFDEIMEFLLVDNARLFAYKYQTGDKAQVVCDKVYDFIKAYRHCVFNQYLPFPSRLIMVSERGGTAEFIDPNMKDAFDAPKTIASLITRPIKPSMRVLQSESMKVVKSMGGYFNGYYQKTCKGKTGMFRGQHGGSRGFFTGRATIAPLAMEHEYDEIHTPWSWSVCIFSVHLENKLLRLGYTPIEILRIIDVATLNYDPLIEDLLKEIIDECPEGGYPVSMLRNPTLRRGSNQYFRITKILTDINARAIMMSVLVIKDPNADFDGDQLQVRLMVDNKEKRQFARLRSHLNIMDTDHPNRIGRHITFHPEVTTMANNFLSHYRKAS